MPEGALAARVCAGGGITEQVPADILTTSVDVLVDAVNALPVRDEEAFGFCQADLGAGYRILFDYDDGSTFLISAHFKGCEDVIVGSGRREHPAVPANTFIRLLRKQRSQQTPPGLPADADDLRCDARSADPFDTLGQVEHINAARVCVWDVVEEQDLQAGVPQRDLATLVDGLAGASGPRGDLPCPATPQRYNTWIVATTSWGDRLVILGDCPGYTLPTGELWVPSPRAQRILDRLVSSARPAP